MSSIVLEANQITKCYKQQTALDNVTLQLKKGNIYGFIGQNGSGKTTLMRIISGIAFPTSGTYQLFKNSSDTIVENKHRMGTLIEAPALYVSLTARENLEMQRIAVGNPDKEIVSHVLSLVKLEETRRKKVKHFSLGMKQKLGIAMSLVGNPEFLILDEPINGLDTFSIVDIRELIKTLNKDFGTTILISSHILNELYELATHFIFIHKGKIIEEIDHDELEEKCQHHIKLIVNNPHQTAVVLEQFHIRNFKVMPDGSIYIFDYLDTNQLSSLLSENQILIQHISIEGENLESYFMNLVGGITA